MKIKIFKVNINKLWLVLYTFFAIFEPPFLPISSIYITGILTVMLIFFENKLLISTEILKVSKMNIVFKIIFVLLLQLIIVNFIDSFFVENSDLFSNRLRCINQLVVLTSVQLLNIYYILLQAKKFEYSIKTLFNILFYAAVIQGIFAVIAYCIPGARSYFLGNMTYEYNEWMLQRRGYGFSQILLDTFGYGMGLIGGYLLILSIENKFKEIIFMVLILFSILMNARTGIVVFLIALIIYMLKTNKVWMGLLKIICTAIIFAIIYIYILPLLIDYGMNSNSHTLQWIVEPINEMYGILSGKGFGTDIGSLSFISHIVGFPSNTFELIFGSGHSLYRTTGSLGFSTDIGYYNMVWIYGLLGTLLWYSLIVYLFVRAYKGSSNTNYKAICIFCAISYFFVQIKANLLGYNPGTFVTYFTVFVLIYYGRHPELQK